MKLTKICIALSVLLGLGMVANGLFLLVSPNQWYLLVPGVISTGPFNQHFLRDIGMSFLFVGIGLLVGAARPPARVFLWGASTLWLGGHALFHIWEVAVGICGPSALARDFPGVTLPAILAAMLTFWAIGNARPART
ncbi:hypothetical protein [Stigmatella aurantiaca]|uniref:Uncharacterized proteim n=1 Tax=Stigmatella aurantiaca (strain DW4/3-1) TaxID=378806 RepID=Q09AV8_STIAD|nr:hypothetical protein [Stigmatella aurantiaca]ADO72418.1 uncharacterized proteim [Stigmatella aurantiaca DW4/3-1]EAU68921.1 conserved hypothetical protein [Stigmatella aurantiaca DW4/3-1]